MATAPIIDFLRRIGVDVRPASLSPGECFLPGLRLIEWLCSR